MKQIKLTRGRVALVDDADYEELSKYKWQALNMNGNFYAVRQTSKKEGKGFTVLMSRQILRLKRGDPRQGDHQNHNTLDNRQDNLRICTVQENHMNQKRQRGTSSKFKGVSWAKRARKWEAYIKISGKKKHLGYWTMEKLAALAYDFTALKYHREFAYFNFN